MKKTAIFLAPGYEEGETLTVADILRRAGFTCDLVGFTPAVEGAHQIEIVCDRVLDDVPADGAYDMVILPGGIPGALNLRDSDKLMEILQAEDKAGKFVAAICAAPIHRLCGIRSEDQRRQLLLRHCSPGRQPHHQPRSRYRLRLCLRPGGRPGRRQPGCQRSDGLQPRI